MIKDAPAYSYVPGGPFPHPISDPEGHSFGRREPIPQPIVDREWPASSAYRRGFDLFNAGYYWEAHEVWEGLWHAHGRRGPTADLIKALIKLAAAGVKVREGQPGGVSTHAGRASALVASVRESVGDHHLGLDLPMLQRLTAELAKQPPADVFGKKAPTAVVFAFRIEPASP